MYEYDEIITKLLKKKKEFFTYFGISVVLITMIVTLFKTEKNFDEHSDEEKEQLEKEESFEDKLTIKQAYKTVWTILCMPPVRQYALILITCRVKFLIFYLIFLK